MQYIDLSVSIQNGLAVDRPGNGPQIRYQGHKDSFPALAKPFPGLKLEDLPDGEAWAVERIDLSTHNGTHMDAPWHYASTMDGGQPAATIDEVPLDWCHRPGVKLDFSHLPDGHVATAADVEAELARIGHALQPLDIVLVHTAAAARYGMDDYLDSGCGMGREATLYLTARGVRVVGTDAWSWDAPFAHTAKRYAQSGDPSIIWEGHKAGRTTGYFQMEKLANLDRLPPAGFQVICFPVKIHRASAGWVRAVALLP
ncbi:cyclase family protein [Variovorax sp. OV329]|uniref:cyclase family protein n=1 Tax=Variovorax sp. OV329 TaxID=1882825 RepID=UPI0008EE7B81|nr:cyclase family protein [Variovorax sp. OV329]SFM94275.1 Kynurenine formamidase [Variovorax sp. OV329]